MFLAFIEGIRALSRMAATRLRGGMLRAGFILIRRDK